MTHEFTLDDFMRESLRIEGIHRDPTEAELIETRVFLFRRTLCVAAMVDLVAVYAHGAALRGKAGMNVCVGGHIPLPGGPAVKGVLEWLLNQAAQSKLTPYEAHQRYEELHPFMDGNGRSGRTLWLWMMGGRAPLGFLHTFYYQALQARR